MGRDSESEQSRQTPSADDFLVEPTRDLADWQWLWKGDHQFPIRSHRGFWGRVLVLWKRLARPLVKVPQNDLWDRQRTFNIILLEHLRRAQEIQGRHHERLCYLETLNAEGVTELMHHNDALFALADQKLDRYRREVRDLVGSLGAALAGIESSGLTGEQLGRIDRARQEHGYFELERLHRGTEEEIRERISRYLPYLAAAGPVLDLGCGRGEALAVLGEHGIAARGVDESARMVDMCRQRGLEAMQGDLFAELAAVPAGSLGSVVSFHVIEHLPIGSLDRLVRLAWRALRPGGLLILETPSPLSLAAARHFWLDPTHQRPVHPDTLWLLFELAGFDPIERLDLRPFGAAERLPEIDLSCLPAEQRTLADHVNRLRDRLDELLFGFQDYGMVGTKPGPPG